MILYYTGTGNSRYAAELLGHQLNDTVRDCTPFMQGGTTPRFHSVTPWVFVCPTYAWQIPHIFADFLTRCHFSGSRSEIRQATVESALILLRECILERLG